jgi:hypothetical protein
MKVKYYAVLPLTMIGFLFSCHDDCIVKGNCKLEPNPGPCEAAIIRYYYDQTENKCKEFIWGGCAGVVPFETLQECQQKCNCGQ